MLRKLRKGLYIWGSSLIAILVISIIIVIQILIYYGKDLPDYTQLAEYDPPSITRVYTNDGKILDEIATENRIYIKYDEIPQVIVNAFISAEDKNFFQHEGVDPISIFRAMVTNILNIGKDKNPVGGSTITQQVVKNFLLTNERSFSRKVKEALLSYRISNVYSKAKVMELYLNQIYLGNNSYGIASAALNYFNKELKDLRVEEAATLAAMPKSPSFINPLKNYARTKERRDWVLGRMYEDGLITDEELHRAVNSEIILKKRRNTDFFKSNYYAQNVRQQLIERFDSNNVYENGLQVYTNLDEKLQTIADSALKNGLLKYDKKYGWRGALNNIDITNWHELLVKQPLPLDIGDFELAVVLKIDAHALIGLSDKSEGVIKLTNMTWAKKSLKDQKLGSEIKSVSDVLKIGDIIVVKKLSNQEYTLEQIPQVNGAVVVLETHSGKVLAEVGGYSYNKSNFDRVTQADRQPGSTFKAFLYLSALEHGFTPSSIVYDQPISLSQGRGMPLWRPKNMTNTFLGPITLRKSLEKSRNVSTVWLLTKLGLNPVTEISERLGIYNSPPRNYSMALGSFETKVLDITNAYNMIASSGRKIIPSFIDRVYDRKGKLLYSSNNQTIEGALNQKDAPPSLSYKYEQVIEEATNYQMISLLKGVIEHGTGIRARSLKRTIGGKTGTTNDNFDTWFIGFTPEITVGVYVGFDNPKTLGQKESGATLALPIFIDLISEALKGVDDQDFPIPENIDLVKVDANTGDIPDENTTSIATEYAVKKPHNQLQTIDDLISNIESESSTSLDGVY